MDPWYGLGIWRLAVLLQRRVERHLSWSYGIRVSCAHSLSVGSDESVAFERLFSTLRCRCTTKVSPVQVFFLARLLICNAESGSRRCRFPSDICPQSPGPQTDTALRTRRNGHTFHHRLAVGDLGQQQGQQTKQKLGSHGYRYTFKHNQVRGICDTS